MSEKSECDDGAMTCGHRRSPRDTASCINFPHPLPRRSCVGQESPKARIPPPTHAERASWATANESAERAEWRRARRSALNQATLGTWARQCESLRFRVCEGCAIARLLDRSSTAGTGFLARRLHRSRGIAITMRRDGERPEAHEDIERANGPLCASTKAMQRGWHARPGAKALLRGSRSLIRVIADRRGHAGDDRPVGGGCAKTGIRRGRRCAVPTVRRNETPACRRFRVGTRRGLSSCVAEGQSGQSIRLCSINTPAPEPHSGPPGVIGPLPKPVASLHPPAA
jgi:hypothetical protein